MSDRKLKKENSYTYWVNNDPLFKDAEKRDYQPKPVHPHQKVEDQQPAQNYHSNWNQSGTWEEKQLDINQLSQQLKSAIAANPPFTKNLDLEVTQVHELKGKANLVFIRGKRKLGYELDLKLEVGGVGVNIDQTAIVSILISDDGDREIKHIDSDHSALKSVVKKQADQIGDVIADQLKLMFN